MGVYLMGVYLMGVHLMSVYLTGVHLQACIFNRHASRGRACAPSWVGFVILIFRKKLVEAQFGCGVAGTVG